MIQLERILKQKKAYKKTIVFLSANSEALINLIWNKIMNLFCKTIKFCNYFPCPFSAGDSTAAQSCSTQGHPGGLEWPLSEEIKVLIPVDKAGQAVLGVTWPPHSNCGLNCIWTGIENNHPLCAISAVLRRLSTSYEFPLCQAPENKPTVESCSALVQSVQEAWL